MGAEHCNLHLLIDMGALNPQRRALIPLSVDSQTTMFSAHAWDPNWLSIRCPYGPMWPAGSLMWSRKSLQVGVAHEVGRGAGLSWKWSRSM